MSELLQEAYRAIDADRRYDADADIVPGYLAARSMQRKVMLGCSLVVITGMAILIAVAMSGNTSFVS